LLLLKLQIFASGVVSPSERASFFWGGGRGGNKKNLEKLASTNPTLLSTLTINLP
jgi:hypothetical protein